MFKAIQVTELAKQYNQATFSNNVVGSIVVFNQNTFPRSYRHIVLDENGEIDTLESWVKESFHKALSYHEVAGFFPVNIPEANIDYDLNTQYLGSIEFNDLDLEFTYPILDYTQAQLDAIAQQQAENELQEDVTTIQEDGMATLRQINRRLIEERKKGNITQAQLLQAQNVLFDLISPLQFGMFPLAQFRIDAFPEPPTQPYKAIYLFVKGLVDTYMSENANKLKGS